MAALPHGGGAKTTMQRYGNESRGYPRAEVNEKSTCFAPVALGLLTSVVLEAIRPGG